MSPISKLSAMTEETRIELPRALINELLRAAQLQPSSIHWGIISGRDGKPERSHPVGSGTRLEVPAVQWLRGIMARNKEYLWAVYCSSPGEIDALNPSDLERLGATLFLAISLGTKGVLQLRGWRFDGTCLQEVDVAIGEA
jgi:[CysO sulfur-carrier protein]-S-L-cysteine hydrolase